MESLVLVSDQGPVPDSIVELPHQWSGGLRLSEQVENRDASDEEKKPEAVLEQEGGGEGRVIIGETEATGETEELKEEKDSGNLTNLAELLKSCNICQLFL